VGLELGGMGLGGVKQGLGGVRRGQAELSGTRR
jgi:hypothetical protein